MSDHIAWAFALNIIINAFFSFFTVTLLILIFSTVLRIKQTRLLACLLTIPFLKLFYDLLLYDFPSWALAHAQNPLMSPPGSRTITAQLSFPCFGSFPFFSSGIQLSLDSGFNFSLADIIVVSISPEWISFISIIFFTTSLFLFGRWIYQLRVTYSKLNSLTPVEWTINNDQLKFQIAKMKVKLLISSKASLPYALGIFKKRIIIPNNFLETLTQNEFEAFIAHELSHFYWHDSLVRLFISFSQAIFWWIPTQWLYSKIKQNQEFSCDVAAESVGLSPLDLVTVIAKTSHFAKQNQNTLSFACYVTESPIEKRVKQLLKLESSKLKINWVCFALISLFCSSLFFGKFWIF